MLSRTGAMLLKLNLIALQQSFLTLWPVGEMEFNFVRRRLFFNSSRTAHCALCQAYWIKLTVAWLLLRPSRVHPKPKSHRKCAALVQRGVKKQAERICIISSAHSGPGGAQGVPNNQQQNGKVKKHKRKKHESNKTYFLKCGAIFFKIGSLYGLGVYSGIMKRSDKTVIQQMAQRKTKAAEN